ncbi:flavodoxin family protein [Nanoarchaeota archaeon]
MKNMKILVAYYSRTGTTRKLAQDISKALNADIEEIIDTKNRDGVLGYMGAGRDGSTKKLTKLEPIKKDPSKYDLIILGTPVWAWAISAPIRTYITENKDKFKKVAFFITKGGSDCEKLFKEMGELAGKNPLATLELKTKEVIKGNYDLKEFSKKVK